ncbi:MAG: glycoside hydrolase family 78 protein [Bacteroidales bacterium]|nr:glycoside hydrolase family 78 protein [Bacteroidales bacterium]
MGRNRRTIIILLFTAAVIAVFYLVNGMESFSVVNLKTEYTEEPLGIDIASPRFSWQMEVPGKTRGAYQTAYKIVVKDQAGKTVWDSEKTENNSSLNIQYNGEPLQPATQYHWTVTVWNQDNKTAENSSWFETGLMNPDPELSAWEGAMWIGGGDEDLVLYAPYLSVFKFNYSVQLDEASGSTRAGFIFGANDSRLMDKNKNILGIESAKDKSYILFEIDISEIDGSSNGKAKFNIYRAGYHPDDPKNVPFKSYSIPSSLINSENKYAVHQVYAEAVFGLYSIYVNGTDEKHLVTTREVSQRNQPNVNLNPVGRGNNSISFPMLGEIGFAVNAGQKAAFSNLQIKNYRSPSNVLFTENLTNSSSYDGIFAEYARQQNAGLQIIDRSYIVQGKTNGQKIIANPSRNAMPMLRTEFETNGKKIDRARLYVTSRGIYEIHLNGKRVGNDFFNPGLTQYNKTHMYQTYDVTEQINNGKNAIGALLGEGWWSGNITYSGENWNYFGDRQSLLAKLVITYTDGTRSTVTTNPESWKYFSNGPIVYSSFFQGEVYNANKEDAVSGWSNADYDDNQWKMAVESKLSGNTCTDESFGKRMGFAPISSYEKLQITGQMGENASIVKELNAIDVEEVRPGVFVYDMGQNMVGITKIEIINGKAGDTITLRYAEVKYPDLPESGNNVGMIMLENIRAALAQDKYILKEKKGTIQPTFTFHGYRFLEITGIENPVPVENVKGLVISSVKELASSYETSNSRVNKLWENITWSTYGNFLSIPTDCPQRNERMGWSGDISVFARTSTYLTDASQFLGRHMLNMRDVQRTDGRFTDVAPLGGGFGGILWGSAGITVAWESYQQYGDLKMLKEHYDSMNEYMAFLASRIDPETDIMNEGPLGDWLSPEGNKNDNTQIWEAYYLYDLKLMTKIATTLNKAEDAQAFKETFEKRKTFFNSKYVHPETHKTIKSGFITERRPAIGDNEDPGSMSAGKEIDTQISYALPLAFGLFNIEHLPYTREHLVAAIQRQNRDDFGNVLPAYSLMTGFIGTAWINKALSDHGYDEIAYRLLQQTSYPSWLYPVDQGATTIWERLNSYTVENGFGGNNGMNSFNHYAFGAIGAWMYNYSLGIKRDETNPGFQHFILQPTPDPDGKMIWAKGHYDSMYGRIESAWKIEDDQLIYHATVPPNTSAMLYLPASSPTGITERGNAIEKADGIQLIGTENGNVGLKLTSGSYSFKAPVLHIE